MACVGSRLNDILDEAKNFDVVALTGTKRRAPPGLEVARVRAENRLTLEAGWCRAPLTNSSSGVLIALPHYVSEANIVRVDTPPNAVQGRSLAVRVRSGWFDLAIVAAYFPPRPTAAKKRPAYEKTVEIIMDFIEAFTSSLPARCTPFLLCDANDGIGRVRSHEGIRFLDSGAVFEAGAALEHRAGLAIHEYMKRHEMLAISTRTHGPTFFGCNGSSVIDYVIIPRALADSVRTTGPLRRLGSKLQLVNTKGPHDHIPTHVCVEYSAAFDAKAEGKAARPPERWHADALMEAVKTGRGRMEFCRAVERSFREKADELRRISKLRAPDSLADFIEAVVRNCVVEVFSSPAPTVDSYKLDARRRRLLLRERRELRGRRTRLTTRPQRRSRWKSQASPRSCFCFESKRRRNVARRQRKNSGRRGEIVGRRRRTERHESWLALTTDPRKEAIAP